VTPTIGSIVASRFQLVRELGRGSMGSVWLADHLTLQLRCAVKFMTGETQRDPNFRTRFEFEARAIAQLQSPHVVRILDYAVADDVPFIAMEFLQGEDLCARLSTAGRLDPATTYRIVSQVARGLAKAHLAGLVHRDIKPENIFLAQEDDEEVVKLLDFGVAKSAAFALQGTGTQAGSLVGTPAYMSPEQARGTREVDHRSDLWSLAVIAYQCLTGKLPFESPTLGDLFGQIMYEAMPVPSKVAPWLTPQFDAWWARAASRNADDRFASARELADSLGQALAIPGVVAVTERHDTWRGRRPPEPSTPPVTSTRPPLSHAPGVGPPVTSTQASLAHSLRGVRQLVRSRYVVAVLGSMAIMVVIGFFNPRTAPAPAVAVGGEATHVTPPAGAVSPGAETAKLDVDRHSGADSSKRDAVGTGESTTSVTDLPQAPTDWRVNFAPTAVAPGTGTGGFAPPVHTPSPARVSPPTPPRAPAQQGHKNTHPGTKGSPDDVDFGI
jgi:serine/threonine-protein kinase